jgi:hypothetical protein
MSRRSRRAAARERRLERSGLARANGKIFLVPVRDGLMADVPGHRPEAGFRPRNGHEVGGPGQGIGPRPDRPEGSAIRRSGDFSTVFAGFTGPRRLASTVSFTVSAVPKREIGLHS